MDLPVKYDSLSSYKKRIVRGEYVLAQNGKCAHCGEDLTGKPSPSVRKMKVTRSLYPPNFFKWPVHLHHSHETGLTIGAVHAMCNAVLWEYYDE